MTIKTTDPALLPKQINLVLACFVAGTMIMPFNGNSRKKAEPNTKAAAYSGNYRNVFAEAGFLNIPLETHGWYGKIISTILHRCYSGDIQPAIII